MGCGHDPDFDHGSLDSKGTGAAWTLLRTQVHRHLARLLAVQQSVRLMVGWLIGFLALTETEQLKAGIYLGGKHRER